MQKQTIVASSKSALTTGPLGQVAGSDCSATLSVTVDKDAPEGDITLFVNTPPATPDAASVSLGSVTLKVTQAVGPGPIPPGLDPGLDLMWKVLPRRAVADSYGSRVADGYFAIEAVLGNETGYDIQLSALGFEVPFVHCASVLTRKQFDDPAWDFCTNGSRTIPRGNDDQIINISDTPKSSDRSFSATSKRPDTRSTPPVPVDAYPVVRGTIEREQSVGTRAIIVNLVKGAGSVLVGVGGFFPSDGSFVRTDGIVSGPFEKALELVYPDLTTNHLVSLDSRTLRDGVVVPNNTSFRINAFISREVVQCGYPKTFWRLGVIPSRDYNCYKDDARMPWQRDFDPNQIMARLGEMVLTGRKIQYLERVRVLNKPDTLPHSEGGPIITSGTLVLDLTTAQKLTVAGLNLAKTSVKSLDPNRPIVSSVQTVADDGRSIDLTIDSSKCVPGVTYKLQAISANGAAFLNAIVAQPPPTITTTQPVSLTSATQTTLTLTGTNLWGATADSSDPADLIYGKGAIHDINAGGTSLTIDLSTSAHTKGPYTLKLKTPGGPVTVQVTGPAS